MNKATGTNQSVETGICLAAALGSNKPVSQFRRFNEIGLHSMLATGITKGLRQVRLACSGRAYERQIPVRIDGAEGWQRFQSLYISAL